MLNNALPVYEVEFIPVEQRLSDRRTDQARAAAWPNRRERRFLAGRRAEDVPAANSPHA